MKVNIFAKRRVFVLFIIFSLLIIYMFSTVVIYWKKILNNIKEKERLEILYTDLLNKEKALENDVVRLQYPEYVAKYAREKYLYSKDGELILKIDDKIEK